MNLFGRKLWSRSTRSVTVLASGSAIAQVVVVLAAPLLTRLYSPAEYGVLVAFGALAGLFAGSSNLRYQIAIVAVRRDATALELARLGILICLVVSISVLVLVVITFPVQGYWDVSRVLGAWLLLLPVAILLEGFLQVAWMWCLRHAWFRQTAVSTGVQAMVNSSTTVCLGLYGLGTAGLMLGGLSGVGAGLAVASRSLPWRQVLVLRSRARLRRLAWRYRQYPTLELPSVVAVSLNLGLVPLFLVAHYSVEDGGQYSLANRLVSLPLAIMGGAFAQVLLRDASRERGHDGAQKRIFDRNLKSVLLVSTPTLLAICLIAPLAVPVVFGEGWTSSVAYVQALAPLAWAQFIAVTTRPIFIALQRQRALLMWALLVLGASVTACVVAVLGGVAAQTYLWINSALGVPVILAMVFAARRHVHAVGRK